MHQRLHKLIRSGELLQGLGFQNCISEVYMKRKQENNLDLQQMHTFGRNGFDTGTKIFIFKNLEKKLPHISFAMKYEEPKELLFNQ